MKKIGIIGGLGPESTMAYYQHITRKYREDHGDYRYPEIFIASLNFQEIIDAGYEIAGSIRDSIEALHRAGADFVVAACNSVHIVYDDIAADLPIPWVSIIDVAAEHAKKAGMKKVGLLGTIFTMSKDFYRDGLARHGLETITPDTEDQKKISEAIFKELVIGEFREDTKKYLLEQVEGLAKKGAEGVILGCTELSLVITQEDTEVTVFDTTALHAERALELALAG